jgi:hypothetical protein
VSNNEFRVINVTTMATQMIEVKHFIKKFNPNLYNYTPCNFIFEFFQAVRKEDKNVDIFRIQNLCHLAMSNIAFVSVELN